MKIADVSLQHFRYRTRTVRDEHGHGHPGEEHEAIQGLLTIATDDGARGHYVGNVERGAVEYIVKPLLLGEDPFYHQRIWRALSERQRLNLAALPDRVLTAVDLALWDLVCKVAGQPVHRLPGAPSVKRDLDACAAVREAVGPDVPLMLDPYHYYSRLD
ncbi:MAG TPA: hypothetical protein VGK33_09240, partial [Chloroflexota bacterium]